MPPMELTRSIRYYVNPHTKPQGNNLFAGVRTREAMYWLGILATDGTITANRNEGKRSCSFSYRASLASTDHDLVNKYMAFMGNKGTITSINKQQSHHKQVISYGATLSTEDHLYLHKLGITQNKGLTLYIEDRAVANNPDFLRGVIDGDGSFGMYGTKKKRTKLSLTTGSEDFAYLIAEVLEGYIKGTPYIREDSRPTKKNVTYEVTINTKRDTRTVLRLLYEDAPEHIRMERKYQRAMELLAEPEIITTRRKYTRATPPRKINMPQDSAPVTTSSNRR